MKDPAFNNSGSISVGGAMVVGNGNTVESSPTPTPPVADSSLLTMLAKIQRAAYEAHLPSPVLSEVVTRAADAQRCISEGQTLQAGEALLRSYAAVDAAVPPHAAAELRQMLETAARMAVALEP